MNTRSLHHISTSLLCVVLCYYMARPYGVFTWQWWAWAFAAAYAANPFFDWLTDWFVSRRAMRKSEDVYRLVGNKKPTG